MATRDFFIRLWNELYTFLINPVRTKAGFDMELPGWVWTILLGIIVFSIFAVLRSVRKHD